MKSDSKNSNRPHCLLAYLVIGFLCLGFLPEKAEAINYDRSFGTGGMTTVNPMPIGSHTIRVTGFNLPRSTSYDVVWSIRLSGGSWTTAKSANLGVSLAWAGLNITWDGTRFIVEGNLTLNAGYIEVRAEVRSSSNSIFHYWNITGQVPTYSVTLHPNGATNLSGLPLVLTKMHDMPLHLPLLSMQRSGYIFSGWNTASGGNGIAYSNGGIYSVNASVTLYAQWIANSLTVDTSPWSVPSTGGSENRSVSSNVAWAASSDASWLTVSPTSGNNHGNFTMTATGNIARIARNATVTVSGGGLVRNITVSQSPEDVDLTMEVTHTAPSYLGGSQMKVSVTIEGHSGAAALGYVAELPAGWSYASDTTSASAKPMAGDTGMLEWLWITVPSDPHTLTYTLNVPAGQSGNKSLSAKALVTDALGKTVEVVAMPNPLVISEASYHSADTNKNWRIELTEVLRVIAFYNYRPTGGNRTGEYQCSVGTADGFAPGTGILNCTHHSADTNKSGRIELAEVLRVIAFYNYRSMTGNRTGDYHSSHGTVDGFAPGETNTSTLAAMTASTEQHPLSDNKSTWTSNSTNLDAAGGQVRLTLDLDYPFAPSAVGLMIDLPAGWSYISDDSNASAKPVASDIGTLEWLWITPPAVGSSIELVIAYPAGLIGDQTLSGEVLPFDASGYPQSQSLSPLVLSIEAPPPIDSSSWSVTPEQYVPSGGQALVALDLNYDFTPSALGVSMTLPAGWTYLSDDSVASVKPLPGDAGTLEWLWITPPASGARVSITLAYLAGLSGDQAISGEVVPFDALGNSQLQILPAMVLSTPGLAEPPVFDPEGGSHPGPTLSVLMTSETQGAWIRYTTDGTEPTESSPSVASGSTVVLLVPGTLKARAWKDEMIPSAVTTAEYNSLIRVSVGSVPALNVEIIAEMPEMSGTTSYSFWAQPGSVISLSAPDRLTQGDELYIFENWQGRGEALAGSSTVFANSWANLDILPAEPVEGVPLTLRLSGTGIHSYSPRTLEVNVMNNEIELIVLQPSASPLTVMQNWVLEETFADLAAGAYLIRAGLVCVGQPAGCYGVSSEPVGAVEIGRRAARTISFSATADIDLSVMYRHIPKVRIISQPVDVLARPRESVSFSVKATGHELSYQWQVSMDGGNSWVDIAEEISGSMNLSNLTKQMHGYRYRCIVLDAIYPMQQVSDAAILQVIHTPETWSESLPAELRDPRAVLHSDSFPNILRFALGARPNESVLGRLPKPLLRVGGQDLLQPATGSTDGQIGIEFWRLRDAEDVQYNVSFSVDLIKWTDPYPVESLPHSVFDSDDPSSEIIRVWDYQVMSSSGSRFMRLEIDHPMVTHFVRIPSGSFWMGDHFDETDEWMKSARPVHEVQISEFLMGTAPVTYKQWKWVYDWAIQNGYVFDNRGHRGWNHSENREYPSGFPYDEHPVVFMNWYDVLKWCNAKSEMEGLDPVYFTEPAKINLFRIGRIAVSTGSVKWDASGYRIPTEAEWERAARGELHGTMWPWGSENPDASRLNYSGSLAITGTSTVKSYSSNSFGLYDTAGNVWEWCWDWLQEDWYSTAEATLSNTRGPTTGTAKVLRGGSWHYDVAMSKVATRGISAPTGTSVDWGFRILRKVQFVDDSKQIPQMISVEGGTFLMQSEDFDWNTFELKRVSRPTTLSAFLMSKFEITYRAWKDVRDWAEANGYSFTPSISGCSDNHPVDNVPWHDAIKWCNALSEMNGLYPAYFLDSSLTAVFRSGYLEDQDNPNLHVDWNGSGFRLPTEAEWTFAAVGGVESNAYAYSGSHDPDVVAWFNANATLPDCDYLNEGIGPQVVGIKEANELGFHDMSGNVMEWCWDFEWYFDDTPVANPIGPNPEDVQEAQLHRVQKGGAWFLDMENLHPHARMQLIPASSSNHYGFRVVRRP